MQQLKEIVLASKSPRRKQILEELGLSFKIIPSDFDESLIKDKDPKALVKKLALEKARSVHKIVDNKAIISADTIVVYNNEVFGKPKDNDDAYRMLNLLSGKEHWVLTGVTIIVDNEEYSFIEQSTVKFKCLKEKDIWTYIKVGKPLDKAGAYGIQDHQVVESYTGSYTNIVGLPMEKLKEALILKGVIDVTN